MVGIAGACGVRRLGVRECWAWGRWCVGRGGVGCFVYLEGADRKIRCMKDWMTCREYGWGGCCGDGEVDVYKGRDFWRESTGASGVEELGALCTWRGQIERFGV